MKNKTILIILFVVMLLGTTGCKKDDIKQENIQAEVISNQDENNAMNDDTDKDEWIILNLEWQNVPQDIQDIATQAVNEINEELYPNIYSAHKGNSVYAFIFLDENNVDRYTLVYMKNSNIDKIEISKPAEIIEEFPKEAILEINNNPVSENNNQNSNNSDIENNNTEVENNVTDSLTNFNNENTHYHSDDEEDSHYINTAEVSGATYDNIDDALINSWGSKKNAENYYSDDDFAVEIIDSTFVFTCILDKLDETNKPWYIDTLNMYYQENAIDIRDRVRKTQKEIGYSPITYIIRYLDKNNQEVLSFNFDENGLID